MRKALGIALVLLLGVGGAVGFVLSQSDDDGDPASGGRELRPPSNVTLIAGRADSLVLSPAALDPLAMPITVEAEERGAATARVTPVMIDGRLESIAWGGGTPIAIDAAAPGGTITLDPAPVEAGPAGVTIRLDGVIAHLSPGTYTLSGPVAIGGAGLATPADAVTFEATVDTTVTFGGTSVIRLPPVAVTLGGPGQVRLLGDVELTGATQDQRASVVEASSVPYLFDLVWAGERIEVDGRIEGDVTVAPITPAVPSLPEGSPPG